jgi:hypothetical protein
MQITSPFVFLGEFRNYKDSPVANIESPRHQVEKSSLNIFRRVFPRSPSAVQKSPLTELARSGPDCFFQYLYKTLVPALVRVCNEYDRRLASNRRKHTAVMFIHF